MFSLSVPLSISEKFVLIFGRLFPEFYRLSKNKEKKNRLTREKERMEKEDKRSKKEKRVTVQPPEMGNDTKTSKTKNPKKANLLDHHSLKHILDEAVTEIVTSRGYVEHVRMSNIRLLLGTIIIIVAFVAQFYPKKFTENRTFLISCIILYNVLNLLLQLIINTKEKNAILFTYPPPGSVTSTGLVVSSKLPRFSDLYTLTIASADPKSISANKPVEFTKSIAKWFTKDGLLVEGLLWKDVEGLVDEYAKEKKSK